MKRAGIGGFQNFDGGMGSAATFVPKRVDFLSPERKDAFKYAATLADQLGLEMARAGSPGWSRIISRRDRPCRKGVRAGKADPCCGRGKGSGSRYQPQSEPASGHCERRKAPRHKGRQDILVSGNSLRGSGTIWPAQTGSALGGNPERSGLGPMLPDPRAERRRLGRTGFSASFFGSKTKTGSI